MSVKESVIWGITGHRLILHPNNLFEMLLRQGEILLKDCQDVYGLTPLAEGADRIFSQALSQLGVPYCVPLPLEQKNYENDFPETLGEFQMLLEKARTVFTLPRCPWLTENDIQPGADGRKYQYLSVGIYIANQSNVLFSVWDGEPARGMGGTEQITNIFQDFTSLKGSINEEQYCYFNKLGKRKKTSNRKLISFDMVQDK